jgi:hypothetical protein
MTDARADRWNASEAHWTDGVLFEAPESWDGDDGAESIALDYVAELEARMDAVGLSRERWTEGPTLAADTSHDSEARPGLTPGVWPQRRDLTPPHFQIVGTNGRTLVVADMVGLIEVGGVHVTDPAHLEEMAERLHALAELMRGREENGS